MINPLNFFSKILKSSNQKELDRISKIVKKVSTFEEEVKSLDDTDFPIRTQNLKERLKNNENINEPIIKDVREKSLSLRASALRCVDEIEPLVETLKLEVEALEQINPEVDIEIYERLSEARNKLTKDAIIMPIKPIIKKDPNFVKSLLVV